MRPKLFHARSENATPSRSESKSAPLPSSGRHWRLQNDSSLASDSLLKNDSHLQNDLLSLYLQHMVGLAPRTGAASLAFFISEKLVSREGTLSEAGARLAKAMARARHLRLDALRSASRRLSGMGLEPSWHDLLLRTFCEPKEGLRNLNDKLAILGAGVAGLPPRNGGRRGDGVLLYPDAYLDIEHAILLPARTYYLVDPLYAHKEVVEGLLGRLSRYCDPADLQVHQSGPDTLVLLPGNRISFVLAPRRFDGMGSEPFRAYSALIFKKPNGSLLAQAQHLNEHADRVRAGGFLLYADRPRGLGEQTPALDSHLQLHLMAEGRLSCFTVADGQMEDYPFVLWAKS